MAIVKERLMGVGKITTGSRVTIPKEILEAVKLEIGDRVQVILRANEDLGEIVIRRVE